MKILDRRGKKVKALADLEPFDLLVCREGNFPIRHIQYSPGAVVITLNVDPNGWARRW